MFWTRFAGQAPWDLKHSREEPLTVFSSTLVETVPILVRVFQFVVLSQIILAVNNMKSCGFSGRGSSVVRKAKFLRMYLLA